MIAKEEVGALVGAALKKHTDPRLGTDLLVLTDEIQLSGDWWYVPVYPEHDLRRLYDYYDALAMTEVELEESGLKIQLVPAHAPESVN